MKHKRFRLGGDRASDATTFGQHVTDSSVGRDLNQVYLTQILLGAKPTPKQIVVGEVPGKPSAFVHRETFEHLSRALDEPEVSDVCVLTGIRGAGKTQLAAAYARAKIDAGCGVIGWVKADTEDDLLKGLGRLAAVLNVADPDEDPRSTARLLAEELATRKGDALLVLDNASDPAWVLPYLPATGTRVIVTSTERSFTLLGEPVDVGSYLRPESAGYLRARTKLSDDGGAVAVAQELGDLPLALAAAAATIELRGLSYRHYLDLLKEGTVTDLMPHRDGQHYPRSTTAALALNFRTVAGDDPRSARSRVLGVVAMMAAEGVPRNYLHALEGFDAETIEQALEHCVGGSVLTWSHNRETVIMHRLMARVVREQSRVDEYFHQIATDAMNLTESKQITRAEGWDRRKQAVQRASQMEAIWQALSDDGPK